MSRTFVRCGWWSDVIDDGSSSFAGRERESSEVERPGQAAVYRERER
jgi:hypothetical protein